MANNKVGQIIYNVQDYYNSGGYISSSKSSPLTSTVNSSSDLYTKEITGSDGNTYIVPDWDKYIADCVDITISGFLGKISINKIGIQAPSGTKVHLNSGSNKSDEQVIMIGRTGMYELDEDILINDVYFEKPKNYILDTKETQQQLNVGIAGMEAAENERKTNMEKLNGEDNEDKKKHNPFTGAEIADDDVEAYWNCYIEIETRYQTKYDTAKGQYNIGVTGIYKLPSQLNRDEPDEKELYNIIIDFEY